MAELNEHYTKLRASYLFSTIAERVAEFQKANPKADIIRLGIGDVTHALSPSVLEAFHRGVDEQSQDASFHGYGPEQGYEFLRSAIAEVDFAGCNIQPNEIFVSDGAKCDTANFQELFSVAAQVAVPDPVYPVYVDSNVMAGRTGEWANGRYSGLHYLEGNEANGFVPEPPQADGYTAGKGAGAPPRYDLVYLCFPNNPTGSCASRETLARWVSYARRQRAIILYDSAYVEFMRDPALPRSIFEIEGAREVAVEFRSLSKTAGFTGVRCAYTVVPEECTVYDSKGNAQSLRNLWLRRQTTKFNGASYPVQRAAEAVFSPEGRQETRERSNYYLENARLIREFFTGAGFRVWGGINSPYVWIQTGGSSWDFFDRLLNKVALVTTPGAGFGKCGEGYIRISSFNHRERVQEALARLSTVDW